MIFPGGAAFVELALQFLVLVAINFLFPALYLIQRRLGDVHMPLLHQRPHITEEKGQKQNTDMAAVHVCIRHADDTVIPQLFNVKILADAGTKRRNHRLDLRIGQHPIQPRLFHVQDLAAQR